MELRNEIADVLARLPVRCDNDGELDKLRRLEAATAILAIPEIAEALAAKKLWQAEQKIFENYRADMGRLINGKPDVSKPHEPPVR